MSKLTFCLNLEILLKYLENLIIFRESKYLLKAYDYLHFDSKLRFRVELTQAMSWVAEHKFSVSWPQFKCMYENMWMVRQFLMTTKSLAKPKLALNIRL